MTSPLKYRVLEVTKKIRMTAENGVWRGCGVENIYIVAAPLERHRELG